MGAVDKEKVKKVVYEMSKVTLELSRVIATLQASWSVTVILLQTLSSRISCCRTLPTSGMTSGSSPRQRSASER